MFTGIVEEIGTIRVPGCRMDIQCNKVLEDTIPGSSIAVNGVCLTAVKVESSGFWCDLSPETLNCTNLGALKEGSPVNLERAAALGDRLSGHIVQGHVDGTAECVSLGPLPGGNWYLNVRIPPRLEKYLILKGSVTLDGASLTVASLDQGLLGVAIIPHTYENTIIHTYRPAEAINVEVDLIGKYVEKLLSVSRP